MQIFKVGTFFMVIGAIILALFVVSVKGGVEDNAVYLLVGLGVFFLGYFLWRRFPGPKPNPSGRFRILKGSRRHPSDEEDEER